MMSIAITANCGKTYCNGCSWAYSEQNFGSKAISKMSNISVKSKTSIKTILFWHNLAKLHASTKNRGAQGKELVRKFCIFYEEKLAVF